MNRILFLLTLPLFVACGSDDDPIIPNEEEVITDLVYVLTPDGGGVAVTMSFSDPDGDGAQAAVISVSDSLEAATTYTGVVSLTNNSDPSDPENITAEVLEENDEHQFFYTPAGGLDASLEYADADDNGNPLGVVTELQTGQPSSGTLRIVLRHEPDKASGATITDPSGAGGETDIEVTFPVSIRN
ncbi:type 1 periplasmic binding fold superfamily protein [Lewinella sp. IMCC34191]|uniref:type 1 periplasmic binding fold superfamily protein n=1 Tax=Lewinella sp. IMCC34191 TaxID=2259172 RepID=UPI000E25AAF7|nr:type 1 periplasmic binding fold superfamily protein [Lewinella sp. IMCC34191]